MRQPALVVCAHMLIRKNDWKLEGQSEGSQKLSFWSNYLGHTSPFSHAEINPGPWVILGKTVSSKYENEGSRKQMMVKDRLCAREALVGDLTATTATDDKRCRLISAFALVSYPLGKRTWLVSMFASSFMVRPFPPCVREAFLILPARRRSCGQSALIPLSL